MMNSMRGTGTTCCETTKPGARGGGGGGRGMRVAFEKSIREERTLD